MTLTEAKDKIAQSWGLKDFKALKSQGRPDLENFFDKVSELLSTSNVEIEFNRWKLVVDEQRKTLSKQYEELDLLRAKINAIDAQTRWDNGEID